MTGVGLLGSGSPCTFTTWFSWFQRLAPFPLICQFFVVAASLTVKLPKCCTIQPEMLFWFDAAAGAPFWGIVPVVPLLTCWFCPQTLAMENTKTTTAP